jgi:hypothetical protein
LQFSPISKFPVIRHEIMRARDTAVWVRGAKGCATGAMRVIHAFVPQLAQAAAERCGAK